MRRDQTLIPSHACRGSTPEMLDAAGLAANVADYPSLCDASILYLYSGCVSVIALLLAHIRLVVPVIRSCQSPTWIWLVNSLHLR